MPCCRAHGRDVLGQARGAFRVWKHRTSASGKVSGLEGTGPAEGCVSPHAGYAYCGRPRARLRNCLAQPPRPAPTPNTQLSLHKNYPRLPNEPLYAPPSAGPNIGVSKPAAPVPRQVGKKPPRAYYIRECTLPVAVGWRMPGECRVGCLALVPRTRRANGTMMDAKGWAPRPFGASGVGNRPIGSVNGKAVDATSAARRCNEGDAGSAAVWDVLEPGCRVQVVSDSAFLGVLGADGWLI